MCINATSLNLQGDLVDMSCDKERAMAITDIQDASHLRIFIFDSAKPVEQQPAAQAGGVPVGGTSGKQQTPSVGVCVTLNVLCATKRLGVTRFFNYKACTIASHFQGLDCFSP
jgi:hypothetical protein